MHSSTGIQLGELVKCNPLHNLHLVEFMSSSKLLQFSTANLWTFLHFFSFFYTVTWIHAIQKIAQNKIAQSKRTFKINLVYKLRMDEINSRCSVNDSMHPPHNNGRSKWKEYCDIGIIQTVNEQSSLSIIIIHRNDVMFNWLCSPSSDCNKFFVFNHYFC